MQAGSCLCGSIKYEITGSIQEAVHCHCLMCQKAHGAAFATYAKVLWSEFTVTGGSEHLASFESSPGVKRTFCRRCGSTLQFIREGRAHFSLAIATLDTDPGVKPSYQVWTSSKAPWWDLQEGLLSYENQAVALPRYVSLRSSKPR